MLTSDSGRKEVGLDGHDSVPILTHIVEVQHPLVCSIARDPVVDRPLTISVDRAVIVCVIIGEHSIMVGCIHTTNGDDALWKDSWPVIIGSSAHTFSISCRWNRHFFKCHAGVCSDNGENLEGEHVENEPL